MKLFIVNTYRSSSVNLIYLGDDLSGIKSKLVNSNIEVGSISNLDIEIEKDHIITKNDVRVCIVRVAKGKFGSDDYKEIYYIADNLLQVLDSNTDATSISIIYDNVELI